MSKQVSIIGGGVIGLCCAYYLQKKGCSVTVIDRGDLTSGTSFGNAGYISPSHFIPLSSPGIVSKGLRWMLSASSPFYIKPRLDPDLFRWALAFWRNANEQTMRRNIPPLAGILKLSRELMTAIRDDLGNRFRMSESGCLMLYQSAGTEKHERELAVQAAALGMETVALNGQQVQDMEPEIEVRVRGGVWYPIDCHLHPGDFMNALKDRLEQDGVEFRLQTEITDFEIREGRIKGVLSGEEKFPCDELILAAGSWLPLLTRKLGFHLLMQAGKGYSMTYTDQKKNLQHPAILVDHRVAMTPMGRDLRMGGTMELSGINDRILLKRVRAIFEASRQYYPQLDLEFPAPAGIWSGLRPVTPDGLPYIGRVRRYSNLVVAGGHAMLGLSLAAATGKLVEELVTSDKASLDMHAFAVERYH